MVPLPVPLKPPVIVSHDWLLAAVHEQAPESTTVTLLDPPLLVNSVKVGLSKKSLHEGTVNVKECFPGSVLKSTALAEPKLP